MTPLPVNADRMLSDLDALRRIGAVGTGVRRPAFSDDDIAARRWLASRMEEAGLAAVVDPWGNLFGLPPGEGPCLLVGSHSDTQPLGGWLDGIYGVVCGLELARAALVAGGPRVAVVSFQDEEGRFGGLTGSEVWAGLLSHEAADRLTDDEGITLAAARARAAEIAQVRPVPPSLFSAYIEAHIEQGPVLDTAGEVLGVVEAIVGVRSQTLTFIGEANHAGTTPMHLRRDAVQGFVSFASALEAAFAGLAAERTVWTIGRIVVEPNASSIVPGSITVSLQIRDPDASRLDLLQTEALAVAARVAADRGLQLTTLGGFTADPVPMAGSLRNALAKAAEQVAPGRWRHMPSGALHDASNVAAVMPVAMLFVPSIGGLSHNPAEDTRREHLVAGLTALAEAVREIVVL